MPSFFTHVTRKFCRLIRSSPNDAHERRPGRAGEKIGHRKVKLGSARPSRRVMRGVRIFKLNMIIVANQKKEFWIWDEK